MTNPHPVPEMKLDGSKIEQVFMNILSNAIEYSPLQSKVAIETTIASDRVRISIKDQGPGIPEAEVGNLFQAFGRTRARKTAGERSIGLGLAITRKIVEEHGGTISVQSIVGEGSTFTVELPFT